MASSAWDAEMKVLKSWGPTGLGPDSFHQFSSFWWNLVRRGGTCVSVHNPGSSEQSSVIICSSMAASLTLAAKWPVSSSWRFTGPTKQLVLGI